VFSIFAVLVGLAQATPPATPEQEARIQSTLSVAAKKMAENSACDFPPTETSDFLAVIGAYEGSTIPTVTVAGQDEDSSLAEIDIRPGRNPIYLLLSSYSPVIWRVTGDTARIRQLIVFHDNGAGVVGVPARKIRFSDEQNCRLPYDYYEGRKLESDVPVLAMLGRRPNAIGADYGLFRAILDDAGVTLDRSRVRGGGDVLILANVPTEPVFPKGGGNGPSTLERDFHRLFPAGVATVDPADVVASGSVERYEVLPMTAGAYQLEQSGALIPATAGDIRRWKDRAIIGGHVRADRISSLLFDAGYRVTRPIQLPAGLCGGYSMTFFVPSRDYVKGDPCHSNIYVDDGTIMASPGGSARAED